MTQERSRMAKGNNAAYAEEAQRLIRARGDYGHVFVRAHGNHLLIEVADAGKREIVARLTHVTLGSFDLHFRNHSGRWEPMPVQGPLPDAVPQALEMLGPFLRSQEIPLGISGTHH